MKHSSGSPSAWKLCREQYRKSSGPVSNPGNVGLRSYSRRVLRRQALRAYLAAWDEALTIDVYLDAERVARIAAEAL